MGDTNFNGYSAGDIISISDEAFANEEIVLFVAETVGFFTCGYVIKMPKRITNHLMNIFYYNQDNKLVIFSDVVGALRIKRIASKTESSWFISKYNAERASYPIQNMLKYSE